MSSERACALVGGAGGGWQARGLWHICVILYNLVAVALGVVGR